MGEVYEESLSINHRSDRNGDKIAYGEMELDKAEIVSKVPYEDWDLGREEFEGYTGNAGMTLERWYHRAAVVICPNKTTSRCCAMRARRRDFWLAVDGQIVEAARKSDEPTQRKLCLEFAMATIQTWSPPKFSYYSHIAKEKVDRSEFPLLLQELDDPDAVVRFLTDVMPNDGKIPARQGVSSFLQAPRMADLRGRPSREFDAASRETVERNAALLETICVQRDSDADRLNVCKELAEHTVNALLRFDNHSSAIDWRVERIDRAGLLVSLVKSLVSVDCREPLDELFDHTLSQVKIYDLTDAHLAAIFALESWLAQARQSAGLVSRWLNHCRTELEQRTEHAPTPFKDLRRAAKLSCSSADCRELSGFSPIPQIGTSIQGKQGRRQHLTG